MARRRFFVDRVAHGRARLDGEEAQHLTRVLRVEEGQQFEISDNESVYLARITAAHKSLVEFEVLSRLAPEPALPSITLYAALVRFERFELLIEKATEMGVSSVVPLIAERSEKGLEKAVWKRADRWRRIAKEASEQSRRMRLPEIAEPVSFQQAAAADADVRLLLDESASQPLLSVLIGKYQKSDHVAILLGPEGGWTERERAAAIASGWQTASLGRLILKAETAAIAALAVLNAAQSSEAS